VKEEDQMEVGYSLVCFFEYTDGTAEEIKQTRVWLCFPDDAIEDFREEQGQHILYRVCKELVEGVTEFRFAYAVEVAVVLVVYFHLKYG
jgi:hypothetical protein